MADGPGLDVATRALVAARRDPDAFGLAFEELWPEVVRRLARATRSPDTARDLAAEAFAKALAHAHRFDPGRGNAMQWLWTIARRELIAWQRRGVVERRARARLGLSEVAPGRVGDDSGLSPAIEAVGAAVDSLGPVERRLVALRVVDGYSYRAVADALGCSPGAARVRYSRAMAKLRVEVARRLGAGLGGSLHARPGPPRGA